MICGDFMQKIADDAYTHKVVICGDTAEFYEYQFPIPFNRPRDTDIKKGNRNGDVKRLDNLFRARQSVRRIIWCNVTPYSKFLTLTTEDTILDVKKFKRMLQTFFQQMKRYGYPLKYLYVLERQLERGLKEGNVGSLHAHIVVFNNEKIPLDILNKAWHYGRSELKVINGLRFDNNEPVRDIGAYICKYITKESEMEFGSRCYNCSVGLKRPKEVRIHGYKMEDSFYVPSERQQLYDTAKELLDIKYSRDGSYEFTAGDGSIISNTYKVYTGIIKNK